MTKFNRLCFGKMSVWNRFLDHKIECSRGRVWAHLLQIFCGSQMQKSRWSSVNTRELAYFLTKKKEISEFIFMSDLKSLFC